MQTTHTLGSLDIVYLWSGLVVRGQMVQLGLPPDTRICVKKISHRTRTWFVGCA